MEQNNKKGIITGFILTAFIITIVIVLFLINKQNFIKSSQLIAHTNQVLYHIENIRSSSSDMETRHRGFLITGNDSFITPYYKGINSLRTELDSLSVLVADNPVQLQNLNRLRLAIAEKTNHNSISIVSRQQHGFNETEIVPLVMNSKKDMEAIRTVISVMKEEEQRLLQVRLQNNRNTIFYFNAILSGLLLVLISALAAGYIYINRQNNIRIKIATELNKQQQVLQSVIDNMPSVINIKDREGNFLLLNKRFRELTNIRLPEAGTLNEKDVYDKESLDLISGMENDIWQNDGFIEFERAFSPNGKPSTFLVNKFLLKDAANIPFALCSISTDITYRKNQESIIQQAYEQVFDLYNNAPCGYHSLDPEGYFIEINSTELSWLGYDKEELIQTKKFSDLLDTEDKEIFKKTFALFKQTGQVTDIEFNLIRKDGAQLPVIVNSIAIYDEHQNYVRSRSTVFDNTERKKSELHIKQLNKELENNIAKLESANRELGAFSYSVSHDLRAPLRYINGYAKILQEEYQTSLDQEGIRLLTIISKNTTKMGQLIDDLLSFSQMGRKEFSYNTVNTHQLVSNLTEEIKTYYSHKKLCLNIHPLPSVEGDHSMMRQVWMNLISNAFKYSEPKSEINIEIGSSIKDGCYLFYIKDNGVGFDMKYIDKLFGVFQRLHRVDEFEGTGVGLAIVKRIILRHSGNVWAESERTEGSTFYFTLPVNPAKTSNNIILDNI